jgi:PncC family amidohydrolase
MNERQAPEPLEVRIYRLMTAKGLTFAAAESCTGGLITHRLTNVPGSSAYVIGGIVAYANEAKVKLLDVQVETLKQYGAVSEQVARQMARGTCLALGTDVALSVTGIAGPGGGTEAKPVGLTYIGLRAPGIDQVIRHVFTGDREANKTASAEAALQLLYDYLAATR